MKAQKWICVTGCGVTTLRLTEHEYKHRPPCSGCGHKDRMVSYGMVNVEITASPASVLGFAKGGV